VTTKIYFIDGRVLAAGVNERITCVGIAKYTDNIEQELLYSKPVGMLWEERDLYLIFPVFTAIISESLWYAGLLIKVMLIGCN